MTIEDRGHLDASHSTLHQLRSQLARVETPPEAKQRALAAALAVFDTEVSVSAPAQTVAVATPPAAPLTPVHSLDDRRRDRLRRQSVWLGAAAAAVAVLGVGALVMRPSGDDSTATEASKIAVEEAAPDARASAGGADTKVLGDSAQAEAASMSTDAAFAPPAEGVNSTPVAETEVVEPTEATAGITQIVGPAMVSPWLNAPQLADENALLNWYSTGGFDSAWQGSLSPVESDGTTAIVRDDGCAVELGLEAVAVLYEEQEVVITRDPATQQVSIVEPRQCTITPVATP